MKCKNNFLCLVYFIILYYMRLTVCIINLLHCDHQDLINAVDCDHQEVVNDGDGDHQGLVSAVD